MVLTVNLAVVSPEGIVTVAGTVTVLRSLESITIIPAVGAGAFRATVPVVEAPPNSVLDESPNEVKTGGLTVRLEVAVWVPCVAVIVASVVVATGLVAALNVTVVDPASTVTDVGTVAAAELLDRLTLSPPVGAAPLRVIVPVELAPPVKAAGLKLSETSFACLSE